MLQRLLAGDIAGALEGGEKVFYFTPGTRYLRAVEHVFFGESYLGYLSLMLVLPILVLALFRRFLPPRWALALALIFAGDPDRRDLRIEFVLYIKWAARGFGDPAAYVLFLCGLVLLLGRADSGPRDRFASALGAGLSFALALFVRPNLAPAAGILLGGAGLGGALAAAIPAPGRTVPGLPAGARHGVAQLGLWRRVSAVHHHRRPHDVRCRRRPIWRRSPSSCVLTCRRAPRRGRCDRSAPGSPARRSPLVDGSAEARGDRGPGAGRSCGEAADPWLRLAALATLVQQCVGIFYRPFARYYYLTWLMTLLVVAVWAHREGVACCDGGSRRSPSAWRTIG